MRNQKIITWPHVSCCWHLCCASSSCFLVKKQKHVFFRLKKWHSCEVQAQRRSVIKNQFFFMNQPSKQLTSDESLYWWSGFSQNLPNLWEFYLNWNIQNIWWCCYMFNETTRIKNKAENCLKGMVCPILCSCWSGLCLRLCLCMRLCLCCCLCLCLSFYHWSGFGLWWHCCSLSYSELIMLIRNVYHIKKTSDQMRWHELYLHNFSEFNIMHSEVWVWN
jgi:hypothetical protein